MRDTISGRILRATTLASQPPWIDGNNLNGALTLPPESCSGMIQIQRTRLSTLGTVQGRKGYTLLPFTGDSFSCWSAFQSLVHVIYQEPHYCQHGVLTFIKYLNSHLFQTEVGHTELVWKFL